MMHRGVSFGSGPAAPLDARVLWRLSICTFLFGVVLIGLGLFGLFVARAWGGCATIPERRIAICEMLGYGAVECTPQFERARLRGTFVLAVQEHVGEANEDPAPPIYASTLTLIGSKGRTVTKTFVLTRVEGGAIVAALEPPCLVLECVGNRTQYPAPQEGDLLDLPNVLNKLLWQQFDAGLVSELRTAAGATGYPLVTWVGRAGVFDHTADPAATRVTAAVRIGFALPWGT